MTQIHLCATSILGVSSASLLPFGNTFAILGAKVRFRVCPLSLQALRFEPRSWESLDNVHVEAHMLKQEYSRAQDMLISHVFPIRETCVLGPKLFFIITADVNFRCWCRESSWLTPFAGRC